ncbi:hypothetical protein Acr_05g0007940 [Actinidia rufa]|uniref:Uncharacterized protein n=1 Tax=Actinidia rufa TaxID=165716 RepID=A0A7J0EL13_9ERIC|nr:hypothetical protein Acr_05g0007940 [Actinidia rufa]
MLWPTCSFLVTRAVIWRQACRPSTAPELVTHDLFGGCLSPNPLDRGKTSPPFSMEPRQAISIELAQSQSAISSSPLAEVEYLARSSPTRILSIHGNYPLRDSLSITTPTITGYSPDGNLSNYVSYISEISFHTYPSEDLAVIHGHGPLLRL